MQDRETVRTLLWAGGVSLLAAILYLLTAARDIVAGDTPELIVAAATLGVPHPPGYPLFTMLGHVFSLLPFGSIPFRINLLSVLCDSFTAGIVFLTAFRLTRSHLASAVAALVLAINPLFWSWSLVAEVFPLNNLLAAVVLYFLVIWQEEPERIGLLAAAAFASGLALANHHTIVLLGPAVCFLLWQRRSLFLTKPHAILLCGLTFLLGLTPYAYVLWASGHQPPYNWGAVSSFSDLLALITRQSYGTHHLVAEIYRGGSVLPRLLALFISLGALLNLLLLLGAIYAYRNRRWYFWFSVLAFLVAGPLFVAITNLNLASAPQTLFVLERFFLLPMVIVGPLLAFGILHVSEFIASSAPTLPARPISIVSLGVGIVLAVSLLTNYKRVDQSGNHVARNYAEDVFATVPPKTVLLATGDGLSFPLLYLQIVEKKRPDVALIFPLVLPADWYVLQLRDRYPSVALPFEHYSARNNLMMLFAANFDRPFAIIGTLEDKSLDYDFQAYQYGLVTMVEPKLKIITINQMVNDNEKLMSKYRVPKADKISPKSFESEILSLYAQPAWRIGTEYERVGAITEARNWYRRALDINPLFPRARRPDRKP